MKFSTVNLQRAISSRPVAGKHWRLMFGNRNPSRAFTLLEVMIAVAIFFIATFAVLQLVSGALANARRLQRPLVDASALASQLSLTNQIVEGRYSGNLGDVLGKAYQEYRWSSEITEVGSNRLFQADFYIQPANGSKDIISRTTTLFYRPQSPPGSLDGGNFTR